jgi:hypothetical protein
MDLPTILSLLGIFIAFIMMLLKIIEMTTAKR